MALELHQIVEALHDARVIQALERALRDAELRRCFRELRQWGLSSQEAVAELAGRPWGGIYLSEERIRTIVYRKGGASTDGNQASG